MHTPFSFRSSRRKPFWANQMLESTIRASNLQEGQSPKFGKGTKTWKWKTRWRRSQLWTAKTLKLQTKKNAWDILNSFLKAVILTDNWDMQWTEIKEQHTLLCPRISVLTSLLQTYIVEEATHSCLLTTVKCSQSAAMSTDSLESTIDNLTIQQLLSEFTPLLCTQASAKLHVARIIILCFVMISRSMHGAVILKANVDSLSLSIIQFTFHLNCFSHWKITLTRWCKLIAVRIPLAFWQQKGMCTLSEGMNTDSLELGKNKETFRTHQEWLAMRSLCRWVVGTVTCFCLPTSTRSTLLAWMLTLSWDFQKAKCIGGLWKYTLLITNTSAKSLLEVSVRPSTARTKLLFGALENSVLLKVLKSFIWAKLNFKISN